MRESRQRIVNSERSSGIIGQEKQEEAWKFKAIDWKFVLSQQHYGTLVYTLIPCIALGLILWKWKIEPALDESVTQILENPDYDYHKKKGSIPALVAVFVPFLVFLLNLLAGELWIAKEVHGCLTNAIYTIVYFLISWFCAFALQIFAQQISAIVVAEPRPDFGDRCQVDSSGKCKGDIKDGMSSFFSGHASSAILSSVYASIYLIWLFYFRRITHTLLPTFQVRKTFRARLQHEFVNANVLCLIFLQLGFAWVVGVSRIVDNRHHIWDVISGMFLGTMVAAFFSIHAIAALHTMPKKDF